MKITIITACFNRAGSIKTAIESVLNQTFPNIEYIVVDGGSTDGSRDIISSYCDRIDKIIFKSDHGMYEGLNNAIREATGDIIGLCHSDDQLYDEDTVKDVACAFEKHPQADMVYADGLFVNATTGKPVRVWKGHPLHRWHLVCGWLPLHTTCYVRRSVHEKYGLYDESYKIAADTKFLLSVLYTHRIKTVSIPQYVVRMRMGGASTDKERMKDMWKEDIRVFKETGFHFPVVMKAMKMLWKPMQFVRGWVMSRK